MCFNNDKLFLNVFSSYSRFCNGFHNYPKLKSEFYTYRQRQLSTSVYRPSYVDSLIATLKPPAYCSRHVDIWRKLFELLSLRLQLAQSLCRLHPRPWFMLQIFIVLGT